jgi:hypothetical protein
MTQENVFLDKKLNIAKKFNKTIFTIFNNILSKNNDVEIERFFNILKSVRNVNECMLLDESQDHILKN